MIKDFVKRKVPFIYKIYQNYLMNKKYRYQKKYERMNPNRYEEELSKIYFRRTGQILNWEKLETYTEKMQWAKIYDNNLIKTKLSDKYAVREWVREKLDESYLIPLLGSWTNADDIDFTTLPEKFVLKTNNGSGTNIVVKDKSKLNIKRTRHQLDKWLNTNYAFMDAFQLHYSEIKPKIICETFIEDSSGYLYDFRFLCFNGKPYFVIVDDGIHANHSRNIYDLNWNLQPWNQGDFKNTKVLLERPSNFNEMIKIVSILCEGFSHVRVDLYNCNNKIYFGEMTFSSTSGMQLIKPDKYNAEIGKLWDLPIE